MQVGLDRLGQQEGLLARLAGARVGLLSHAASVDRSLTHVVTLLAELGVAAKVLFAPEHGFGGAAQDMAAIDDCRDADSGVRIVSLYGDQLDDLVVRPADLQDLDVLLIDLCDVGSRYYTYVWTALLSARAAADAGVHVVLLDRPNPINGLASAVEGMSQQSGYTSFVGWERVPIRHSLTLAEMVCLHVPEQNLGPEGALSVVGLRGWDRAAMAPIWDRPFVLPSPNMPTWDTALVYPGGCLLEGTNLSEGRGHTRPFEVFGAPWLDGERLAGELNAVGLEGFVARPLSFMPTFHKHAGQLCGGLQVHVRDPALFRPVATYAATIALAHHQDPQEFRFRTERYEFVDDLPAFDLLTGSDRARLAILDGAQPRIVAEMVAGSDPIWPERMREAAKRVEAAAW